MLPLRLRPGLESALKAATKRDAFGNDERICRPCLARVRNDEILARLSRERGALSTLETEIAQKAASHASIASDLEATLARSTTLGQRIADGVARVGGSWPFVIGFITFLVGWIVVNARASGAPFDPYPFILLNLLLSCVAALQAPIIMMSQNRSAMRDRAQADQDFRVNLKAELEIATLHDKFDHLVHAQWQSLLEMQELQIELLQELTERRSQLAPQSARESST